MPTSEQNKVTVGTFAREVFGNKNLDHADTWLADDFVEHQVFPGTTPDKKGALDSYRIFFAASPDMTAEIHDIVAAGDKGRHPGHLPRDRQQRLNPRGAPPARPSRWTPSTSSGSTSRARSPSTGEWSTPSAP
jgi:hypothetical protein